MSEFNELKIDGRVATPQDDDWDAARLTWNLTADAQPEAVAFVEGADDIAAVLRFAAVNDLTVIGQGTGHGAVPGRRLRRHDRDQDRAHARDLDRRRRRHGPDRGGRACRWRSATPPTRRAMCSLPGSSPDVGVIGYSLGGGVGWLGRKYGFACNRLTAIEVVTADGEQRHVDADSEPELFWALRGGGGSLRHRRRDRGAPGAPHRGLRRHDHLPRATRGRRAARLSRLGGRVARRDQLDHPLPAPAPAARRPRAASRHAPADLRRGRWLATSTQASARSRRCAN